MREVGFVKKVSGSTCSVAVKRKTACGENCATCKGTCSAGEQICVAKNSKNVVVGDKVIIEIDSKKVLKSAFLVYILPILAFLAVFMIISEYGGTDGMSAISAAVSAVMIFVFLRVYDKRHKNEFIPEVVEILNNNL